MRLHHDINESADQRQAHQHHENDKCDRGLVALLLEPLLGGGKVELARAFEVVPLHSLWDDAGLIERLFGGSGACACVRCNGWAAEPPASRRISIMPRRRIWPGFRTASVTFSPLIKVPLVESRSLMSTSSPRTTISAWWLDTEVSGIWKRLSS